MNHKFLLVAGTVLLFSSSAYAGPTIADSTHSATVIEKLIELKDNLKNTAQGGMEKFSEKLSEIYQSLSTQIDEIFHNLKDKKDDKVAQLKQKRDELKKDLDNYNQTKSAQIEEMRSNLVEKLEELNAEIIDYNKSLKK
jgi:citrate synthase